MSRGRYKRKCVAEAAGRASKRNHPDLSDDGEFQDTYDTDTQEEEEFEEIDETEKSAEEIRAECKTLIRQAFDTIGMDVDSYLVCFNACVDKAINTGMAFTTKWSKWGGYRDFNYKLTCVAQSCKKTKKLHCPTAPAIVVAYVLLEIRKIPIEASAAYDLMKICKTFYCAATAIHYYEQKPDVILKIDAAFDQPSSWPPLSRDKAGEIRQFARIAAVGPVHHGKPHYEQLFSMSKGPEAFKATPETCQTYEVQVSRTITRQEAEQALESIIEPFRVFDRPESSLFDQVTLPRLKVLSYIDKNNILWWIRDIEPQTFSEWMKETKEDLEQYRWVETVKRTLPKKRTGHSTGATSERIEERTKDSETHGIDPVFYEKMNQWMVGMECKMDEQETTYAKVLNKLDLVDGQLAELAATNAKMFNKLDLVDGQVAELAATNAKILKRLDLLLTKPTKPTKTSGPVTEDAESSHLGECAADVDVAEDSFFTEQ